MNLTRPSIAIVRNIFRLWLTLRRLLPNRKCKTFTVQSLSKFPAIDKIYVINLDCEQARWSKMKQELKYILDSSGAEILKLTERYSAVDAKQFSHEREKDAEIDPFYTLGDQLFVEPQPLVIPTHLELNTPIRMSRAEIAIAQSHINVWKKVAVGNNENVLILEDDTWFHTSFAKQMDQAWSEIVVENNVKGGFDVLYVSYLEVKHGAPKSFLSNNLFRPLRGLWHMSGYVLSRKGAEKLLRLLPCRGPIDLWINHHFEVLDVFATKNSLINQRRDITSSNSYSILPTLTKIGAINSEGAFLFNIHPTEHPVFAFGPEGSGLTSLAMALSMLGYRCCSDFNNLPTPEMERLLAGKKDRVFNAYVNIGSLKSKVNILRTRYPNAKFIITATNDTTVDYIVHSLKDDLNGADISVLHLNEINKWHVVCQYLRCAPPTCSFPVLKDLGQRQILDEITKLDHVKKIKIQRRDNSPWLVESRSWWKGINVVQLKSEQRENEMLIKISDRLEHLDTHQWLLRSDTFTDNLALFRPSNVEFRPGMGAVFSVKKESLGVRNYSASSLCGRDQYLFGKFEAIVQASNVPGVVTGIFLQRNSPEQEIDIEIAGDRPNRLLVNVFYNPGDEGANFDYGYRGSPTYIDLGFDASKECHRFTIEWNPCEILWLVDNKLVHRRGIWDPTPIPNLPMTLHINSWITRSIQLAGRINDRRLPAMIIVGGISLETNSVFDSSRPDEQQL
ncbi:MAG: family 16 glycosylhydrolase [Anaerolineales bacterium]|nr:family 16 glycosylhydrolase [Anaerolineales bacterium]